jgi:DNA-directed RNA polymerase subunit M/transcription elongation factor TFIIS
MKQQKATPGDIKACPRCHEVGEAMVEPTMREGSDADGPLIFWRCAACRAIFSRRTLVLDGTL